MITLMRLVVVALFVVATLSTPLTHQPNTLQASTKSSLTYDYDACFYNFYLGNQDDLGFVGSTVTALVDNSATVVASLPIKMKFAGFRVDVVAGQTITLVYNHSSEASSSNQVWLSDANGQVQLFQANLTESQNLTLSAASCQCTYLTASDCPAVGTRNEWRALSFCEQKNLLNALNDFRKQDDGRKFEQFIVHHHLIARKLGQGGFFTWHRRFASIFEQSIRAVGDPYGCVSLPYWDWGLDFGYEDQSSIYDDWGGIKSGECLSSPFNGSQWVNPVNNNMCVRRRCVEKSVAFTPISAYQWGIISNDTFSHLTMFFARQPHSTVHKFVGGNDQCDFLMKSAPADPLFWLHHMMIDRGWALWQDCWDFDQNGPSNYQQQWEDLTDYHTMDINTTFPYINSSTYEVLDMASLQYRYTPMYDEWQRWNGAGACKWDWFDPESYMKVDTTRGNEAYPSYTRVRHQVYNTRQLETLQTLRSTYQSALEVSASHDDALTQTLNLECALGNPWDKEMDTGGPDTRICHGNKILCADLCTIQKTGYLDIYAHNNFIWFYL